MLELFAQFAVYPLLNLYKRPVVVKTAILAVTHTRYIYVKVLKSKKFFKE